IGSLGSLAVITRINFRTFPTAPEQRTHVTAFAGDRAGLAAALGFCKRLAESQLQLRVLEMVSGGATRLLAQGGAGACPAGNWCVVTNAAGHGAAVERHQRDLETLACAERACEFIVPGEVDGDALLGTLGEFPRLATKLFPGAAILR